MENEQHWIKVLIDGQRAGVVHILIEQLLLLILLFIFQSGKKRLLMDVMEINPCHY